ncbi:MFS transporter [Microbacterium sp. H1-D42]|nr:MFS transporter [Microbacterium sp. H1-D42]UNK72626.1 MFS transporter [Microbacterium sp. H1-D42]
MPHPTPTIRRARVGVALLFLTNGALLANILPRYPEIKASLGLDATFYGLSIAAFPAGAIFVGLSAAVFIRRFGSARVAMIGSILTALALLFAGLAPTAIVFALGLFLAGAADAITDVAQNAHSLRVQRAYDRSIINSFHAIWSIGAVLGGSMAAVAIALRVPVGAHLAVSTVVFGVVVVLAYRMCLPGPDAESGADAGATASGDGARTGFSPRLAVTLVALILIATAGAVIEDAGMSWATLYLSDSLGAAAALAATGYIALVGAQFVGRIFGDRLIDRFGARAMVISGGLFAAAGMGLALAFPTVPGTILGFALAGLGSATLIPTAFQEADDMPGLKHGSGITIVAWMLRFGFLLAPPVVGVIADNVGLRAGLVIVPIAGLVAVVCAGAVKRRMPTAD